MSALASLTFKYGMKYLYFVSLSMMTRIESYSTLINRSFKSGSLTMKSKAIDFHAPFSVGGDLSCLYGKCLLAFNLLQMSHSYTTISTYFRKPRK